MISSEDITSIIAMLEDHPNLTFDKEFLLELFERIKFLEARQTELQEEGTKLVTERRELKAKIKELTKE